MKNWLDRVRLTIPSVSLKVSATIVGTTLLALGSGGTAKAINLTLDRSFSLDPSATGIGELRGVTFDPVSRHLFITGLGTPGAVSEIDLFGNFISSFIAPGFTQGIEGLSVLPNGNLLLSDDEQNDLVEYTRNGVPVSHGIIAGGRIKVNPTSPEADGVAFNPLTGTIFVADSSREAIYEFSTEGTLLSAIDVLDFLPGVTDADPEGIEVDPLTGNLFYVDDTSETNSLYELAPDGTLLSNIDLLATFGFDKPQGITLDPVTRTLYIAFGSDRIIGAFNLTPRSSKSVPEPATALGLLVGGILGMGVAKKRR